MHVLTTAGSDSVPGSPTWYQPDLGWLPNLSRATAAGISVAIVGNVLISFALNCQKLAHRRLEQSRRVEQTPSKVSTNRQSRIDEEDEDDETGPQELRPVRQDVPGSSTTSAQAVAVLEAQPLLLDQTEDSSTPSYGTGGRRRAASTPTMLSRLKPWRKRAENMSRAHIDATHSLMPVDAFPVQLAKPQPEPAESTPSKGDESPDVNNGHEGDYLKSKLWWLGFLLMNIGEMGNFISYAFAPASVVAPLGTFALIANCVFAPLMLRERFRKRDFFGIVIAILGAITVVLSANPSDTRLDHEGLIRAISQRVFLVYSIVYVVGAIILSGLSESEVGRRHVFVDVGLCALFGGFTVLSTKAISTLLTKEWFEIFAEWITYPVIAVLLGTGIGQIRYLNRALMRFDSKIVVPTQFVMFNLSAIVGSAILYGDFKRATFHQMVTFLYGCGATFAGVFMIAWAPNKFSPNEDGQDPEQIQDDVEAGTTTPSDNTMSPGVGSLNRRSRATLVVPEHAGGSITPSPILRNKQSLVSLVGLSPAQYSQRLLLVHTPPQQEFVRPVPQDLDAEVTQGSFRRRTMSWLGDERGVRRPRPRITSAVTSREASRNREPDTTGQSPRRFH